MLWGNQAVFHHVTVGIFAPAMQDECVVHRCERTLMPLAAFAHLFLGSACRYSMELPMLCEAIQSGQSVLTLAPHSARSPPFELVSLAHRGGVAIKDFQMKHLPNRQRTMPARLSNPIARPT